ncbi:hypothetical protein [Mycoplasmopsis glycophila]|uniref:Uncharacterized protein n=1 Tax=Mycoplasmopsis glycophila TaxID=171285 RepID=A0A449AV33_9BACT|nr:hypothetical protein [Mycoplasmopsis glycophila]VEU70355.1 Uncharacterised protein [Mycoplasmopsis glycophila]
MKSTKKKRKTILPINHNYKIDKKQQKLVEQIIQENNFDSLDQEKLNELKRFRRTYIWAIIVVVLVFLTCILCVGYFFYRSFF